MILKGGIPGLIAKPGPGVGHGILPSQISLDGGEDSPLLNDVNPGDATTQMIWALVPALPATGTTQVTDLGGYALLAPAVGIWSQAYRLLAMPFAGPAVVEVNNIVTIVDAPVGATVTPRRRQVVSNLATTRRPTNLARS